VILLGSMNKCNAGTEMHVFMLEIVLSVVNKHSLLKLCCLQQISVHCRNCVVCSELVFAVESVL
jgi:hypothetical protein